MKKQPEGSTFWLFDIILVCYVGQEAVKFINYFWWAYDCGFLAKAADHFRRCSKMFKDVQRCSKMFKDAARC